MGMYTLLGGLACLGVISCKEKLLISTYYHTIMRGLFKGCVTLLSGLELSMTLTLLKYSRNLTKEVFGTSHFVLCD